MQKHREIVDKVAQSVKQFYKLQQPFRIFHGSTNSTRNPHTSPSVHPFVRPQGLAPRDAWEACPEEGKLQIIGFIGVLETVTELIKPHYTKAGKEPYPPMIKPRKGYFNPAILEGELG